MISTSPRASASGWNSDAVRQARTGQTESTSQTSPACNRDMFDGLPDDRLKPDAREPSGASAFKKPENPVGLRDKGPALTLSASAMKEAGIVPYLLRDTDAHMSITTGFGVKPNIALRRAIDRVRDPKSKHDFCEVECPISYEQCSYPVQLRDGHTYDIFSVLRMQPIGEASSIPSPFTHEALPFPLEWSCDSRVMDLALYGHRIIENRSDFPPLSQVELRGHATAPWRVPLLRTAQAFICASSFVMNTWTAFDTSAQKLHICSSDEIRDLCSQFYGVGSYGNCFTGASEFLCSKRMGVSDFILFRDERFLYGTLALITGYWGLTAVQKISKSFWAHRRHQAASQGLDVAAMNNQRHDSLQRVAYAIEQDMLTLSSRNGQQPAATLLSATSPTAHNRDNCRRVG